MTDLPTPDTETVELTAHIVSAYVAKNSLPSAALPEFIKSVHSALTALSTEPAQAEEPSPVPAVSVRSSVKADAITCLECGRKFRSLKRHIGTIHGLTPEQYRERWQLKADYPMVAPDYTAERSDLAKKIGLGKKR